MDFKASIFSFFLLLGGTTAATLTLNNSCPYTVWPAILTNPGSPNPPDAYAGFELPSQALKTLDMPPVGWSGSAWARTLCTASGPGNSFTCATGDCRTGNIYCGALPSAPVTFIELNLANVSKGNTNDSYQVSVAAGYNVPVSVVPPVGLGCIAAGCPADVNAICPEKFRVVGDGGKVIACKSACQVFQDPMDCCLGDYKGPTKCKPTQYSKIFKGACPMAMSYIYDNAYQYCKGGSNYLVTFCPGF